MPDFKLIMENMFMGCLDDVFGSEFLDLWNVDDLSSNDARMMMD